MSRLESTDKNSQKVNVNTKRPREIGGLLDALSSFEDAIESLVEDSLLNSLRARGHPVEIAKKLARVMGDETCIWLDGRLVAPDKYVVQLRPKSYSVYNNILEIMEQDLAEYLQNAAEENKPAIYFLTPPIVKLEADSDKGRKRISIKAYWGEDSQEKKARPQTEQKAEKENERLSVATEFAILPQETNNDIEGDKALPDKLKEALQKLKSYEIVGKIDHPWSFIKTAKTIYNGRTFLGNPEETFEKIKNIGRNKEVWKSVYEALIKTDQDQAIAEDLKVRPIRTDLGLAKILGIADVSPNVKAVLADLEARYPVIQTSSQKMTEESQDMLQEKEKPSREDADQAAQSIGNILQRIDGNTSGDKFDLDQFQRDTLALQERGALEDGDIRAYLEDFGTDSRVWEGLINRINSNAEAAQTGQSNKIPEIQKDLKVAFLIGMGRVEEIKDYLEDINKEYGEQPKAVTSQPGKEDLNPALNILERYGKTEDSSSNPWMFIKHAGTLINNKDFLVNPEETFEKIRESGRNQEVWGEIANRLVEGDRYWPDGPHKVSEIQAYLEVAKVLGIAEAGPNTKASLADLEARYAVKQEPIRSSEEIIASMEQNHNLKELMDPVAFLNDVLDLDRTGITEEPEALEVIRSFGTENIIWQEAINRLEKADIAGDRAQALEALRLAHLLGMNEKTDMAGILSDLQQKYAVI